MEPYEEMIGIIYCTIKQKFADGRTTVMRATRDVAYSMDTSFNDVFRQMLADSHTYEQMIMLITSYDITVTLHKCPLLLESAASLLPVSDNNRCVHFYLNPPTHHYCRIILSENCVASSAAVSPPAVLPNAFNVLMSRKIVLLLPKKHDTNNKLDASHLTHNNLIDHFAELDLGWTGNEHSTDRIRRENGGEKRAGYGPNFLLCLSEVLSYISLHHECSLKDINIAIWLKLCTNKKTWKKGQLSAELVNDKVDKLRSSMKGSCWVTEKLWKDIIADIEALCKSLKTFAETRLSQATIMRRNRESTMPARSTDDAFPVPVKFCGISGRATDRMHTLVSNKLKNFQPFEPFLIDDTILLYGHTIEGTSEATIRKYRSRFIGDDGITLKYRCKALSYIPGGALQKLIWVWRIDEDGLSPEDSVEKSSRVVGQLKANIPVYESRAALREINKLISNLATDAAPAVKVLVRQLLKMDSRKEETEEKKNRQSRLLNVIMNSEEQYSMVIDLRKNNGREKIFDAWFTLANSYVASCNTTAHDRRRDGIERFTTWISFHHFMEQVCSYHRITFSLEEYSTEPSESTVMLAFTNANPYRGRSDFTGRLNVCRTIQKRQSHVEHTDTHNCHALRRMLKEFCISAKDSYCNEGRDLSNSKLSHFLLKVESDDKAKVAFGEPSHPVDTGVRPHGRIVAPVAINGVAIIEDALDHSFHLGSLTPSVNLFQIIPTHIDSSWVTGDVKVTINDSVFRPSNGFQHFAQLALQIINCACIEAGQNSLVSLRAYKSLAADSKILIMSFIPSIVLLSTDGGGDHKNTNLQNQAAQLSFLLLLDLHCFICNRNAPDGSWVNSVERVMSLLNLGLQHTAYARKKCETSRIEKMVHQCNSMSMLREKAQQMPAIESEWTEDIKPVIEGITERFKALTLKGRKVVVVDTGDTDDVVLLKELLLEECPDYNDQLRKKSDLKSMPNFRDRLTWGGGRQTNYLSEIRGSDNRTPGWLKSCPFLGKEVLQTSTTYPFKKCGNYRFLQTCRPMKGTCPLPSVVRQNAVLKGK